MAIVAATADSRQVSVHAHESADADDRCHDVTGVGTSAQLVASGHGRRKYNFAPRAL